jgi:hypothetical protein
MWRQRESARAVSESTGRIMKPRVWIPLLLAIFAPFSLPAASYSVQPAFASSTSPVVIFQPEIGILEEAQQLFAKYGPRPPYNGPVFAKNEPLSPEEASDTLPFILACESGGRDVSELDSNHKMSRGTAQFQDATWAERQAQSAIQGTATEAIPAVLMSLWSLEHGYISQWSCAALEKIIGA